MFSIIWDNTGERWYDAGLDRGVLYPRTSRGVAWNGLLGVTQGSNGGGAEPHYLDGRKEFNEQMPEEFIGTIEAYTYPRQFEISDGLYVNNDGVGYTNQLRSEFGLSYRTGLGSDVDPVGDHYQIHLIYNALASPSTKDWDTISEDVQAVTFTWDFTTRPVFVEGVGPVSHIVLDTRRIKSSAIAAIEDVLYGTPGNPPRLPDISEVSGMIYDFTGFEIHPDLEEGLAQITLEGINDLSSEEEEGLYQAHENTRLVPRATAGLYRLE